MPQRGIKYQQFRVQHVTHVEKSSGQTDQKQKYSKFSICTVSITPENLIQLLNYCSLLEIGGGIY